MTTPLIFRYLQMLVVRATKAEQYPYLSLIVSLGAEFARAQFILK